MQALHHPEWQRAPPTAMASWFEDLGHCARLTRAMDQRFGSFRDLSFGAVLVA